jgi:hypothetical protein
MLGPSFIIEAYAANGMIKKTSILTVFISEKANNVYSNCREHFAITELVLEQAIPYSPPPSFLISRLYF